MATKEVSDQNLNISAVSQQIGKQKTSKRTKTKEQKSSPPLETDSLESELLSSTALNKLTRAEVISKFRVNQSDVGSSEVQIALITQRLARLALHFRKHNKDIHSQRGMHAMINRRKKLLAYLKGQSLERYNKVLASLGLRK